MSVYLCVEICSLERVHVRHRESVLQLVNETVREVCEDHPSETCRVEKTERDEVSSPSNAFM